VLAADLTIKQAGLNDVEALVPLFDSYRLFYEQGSDVDLARSFLTARLTAQDSVIFIASLADQVIGFTQLYPSFSSTRAARIYVLNDLYVASDARRSGAGAALLDAAKAFGAEEGAARLTLSTAHSNVTAQSLYERNGWVQDSDFRVYNFAL
jgi:ribosomal protein S18 acetylase RimI-like enzyme